MTAYYNEFDPKAAAWLRELIREGLIADGEVDERSIVDVRADDLRGFAQCHFFAGIGGWSLALRLADWPDDRPVWTGSCPCQPFSAAGKQAGTADARHLWPDFGRLIGECRPSIVFGEQVASALGRGWLAAVRSDLEALGYAVGAADLCAAGLGAPHIRQRLYWGAERLADSMPAGWSEGWPIARSGQVAGGGLSCRLADADDAGLEGRRGAGGRAGQCPSGQVGVAGWLADADGGHSGPEWEQRGGQQRQQQEDGGARGLADADLQGSRWRRIQGFREGAGPRAGASFERPARLCEDCWSGSHRGGWSVADWLYCRDGKWRPVEPGTFPLAHGLPARVGRLRGYGNAIVPQVAEAFIRSFV